MARCVTFPIDEIVFFSFLRGLFYDKSYFNRGKTIFRHDVFAVSILMRMTEKKTVKRIDILFIWNRLHSI